MKKQNIIYVLKILETESDQLHPITQSEIADAISDAYKYFCDRKTVGRNICTLKEMGYPIVKTSRGFYMDKKSFSIEERELVLSAVREYPNATDQLIERLTAVLNKLVR